MSIHQYTHLEAETVDYHADRQVQRVERAKRLIDPSDVLIIVDSRLAAESDPKAHPLFGLVNFLLDGQPACDGGKLYDDLKRLVLAAIDTALDEALRREVD
jgi:hypothetical protein